MSSRTVGQSAGELVDRTGGRRAGPVEEDLGFRPPAVGIERGDGQVKRPVLREGVEVAAASGRERHGDQRLSRGVDRRRHPGPDAELEALRQQFGSDLPAQHPTLVEDLPAKIEDGGQPDVQDAAVPDADTGCRAAPAIGPEPLGGAGFDLPVAVRQRHVHERAARCIITGGHETQVQLLSGRGIAGQQSPTRLDECIASGLSGGGLGGAKRETHTVQRVLPGAGQVENRGAVAGLVPGAGEVRSCPDEELPRAGMLPGGHPVHGTDIEEVAGGGEGGLGSRPETYAVVGMQAFDQRFQKSGTGSRGGRTGIEGEHRAGTVDRVHVPPDPGADGTQDTGQRDDILGVRPDHSQAAMPRPSIRPGRRVRIGGVPLRQGGCSRSIIFGF